MLWNRLRNNPESACRTALHPSVSITRLLRSCVVVVSDDSHELSKRIELVINGSSNLALGESAFSHETENNLFSPVVEQFAACDRACMHCRRIPEVLLKYRSKRMGNAILAGKRQHSYGHLPVNSFGVIEDCVVAMSHRRIFLRIRSSCLAAACGIRPRRALENSGCCTIFSLFF